MVIILSLIFPILAFILESYPRLINRKFGVDIWTHLLYLKEYHKQKGIPTRIGNGFLVPGEYDYPPAFIFILSKFPFKLVEKYEFLFSPFFDALHLILIFFIVQNLTGNVLIPLITQILYVLTPIIILENSSATPRSLGYTLFTIVFMSLFLFSLNNNYWFLFIAIISGSFIFLSHRFTTQGFLFFSIFFSILDRNAVYLLFFFLSFIVSVVISKGFYLKVLEGHIGNLKFWKENINYRFAHQVKGNYKEFKTQDFVFKLYNQFLKFPPFVFTITNPWTLPVFYLLLFDFPKEIIIQKFLWLVIFSYILALATTWIPQIRFFGEGQRYLELSAFPAAFLSAKLIVDFTNKIQFSPFLFAYIVMGIGSVLTIIVIQRKAIIKDKLRTLTPQMEEMFAYLSSLKVKPKLLCMPHQITTNTIYHTNCPVFVNADYKSINKIADVYPFIRKPIKEIMKEYDLDFILMNEDYATIEDLKVKNYDIVKKVNNFLLIKIK